MFKWLNFFKEKQAEKPAEPKKEPPSIRFAQEQADKLIENRLTDEALKKRYQPYEAPKGVRGDGQTVLAMDAYLDGGTAPDYLSNEHLTPALLRQLFADGIVFQGYPILAEMANRAELRKPCEIISKECVREWIEFKTTHNDKENAEDKGEKIEALRQAFEDFNIRKLARDIVYQALIYGIAHVWFHVGEESLDSAGQALPLTIGEHGVEKGSVKGFKCIEAIWVTPNSYRADNPLQPDYYKPDLWWCQGVQVHHTRLERVVPFEVSDLLKPAFNFGGLSLTQQLKPYTHNYLRIRNATANIVANFSKLVLQTDMAANMSAPVYGDGEATIDATSLAGRAKLLQALSEGQDTIVADKENEDVKIVSAPLGGLDHLQAQAMEAQASIASIPLVKLFGITPTGLNASSEGEIRVFYDEIKSFQETNLRPVLQKIFDLIQLHLWGERDQELRFEFVSLTQETPTEKTNRQKVEADTDALYLTAGVISAEEVRERLQCDDESPFQSIDLSGNPPEPPENEMEDGDLNALLRKDIEHG